MRRGTRLAAVLPAIVLGAALVTPALTGAQNRDTRASTRQHRASAHRQQTKNQWRNIAIGSGALGVYGLLKHDNTLAFAGMAGALYSANRYEQDRKSQSRSDRARAAYFGRRSFTRNGHHYTRRTVWQNGRKHYQFVRR